MTFNLKELLPHRLRRVRAKHTHKKNKWNKPTGFFSAAFQLRQDVGLLACEKYFPSTPLSCAAVRLCCREESGSAQRRGELGLLSQRVRCSAGDWRGGSWEKVKPHMKSRTAHFFFVFYPNDREDGDDACLSEGDWEGWRLKTADVIGYLKVRRKKDCILFL